MICSVGRDEGHSLSASRPQIQNQAGERLTVSSAIEPFDQIWQTSRTL
jgi:hypothetical protein